MLLELTVTRANMNTAANPDADWLFPGGRAGPGRPRVFSWLFAG
ncbi:hypothetical protein [Actinoallomurus rhizosphaericola]|nr:hypothetical protein [Actinoallomurus rhizosphaericola]